LPLSTPAAIFEFGLNCSRSSKHAQVGAYAVNLSHQLKSATDVLLTIEFIIGPTGCANHGTTWICIRGFDFAIQKKALDDCLIWSGYLDYEGETIGRLLSAIETVIRHNIISIQDNLWKVHGNASIDLKDGYVRKLYDYRHRNVPRDQRRSHELSLQFIDKAEIVYQSKNITLIQYPIIQGECWPRTVDQFYVVCKKLSAFHEAGFIHGDIRAFNCIFSDTPENSCLIDFDFSGKEGTKYPDGFNLDIIDGGRHRDVKEGELLSKTHDWYGILQIMKLLVCAESEEAWKNAKKLVKGEKIMQAIKLLKTIRLSSLSMKEIVKENLQYGTGTPPRKKNPGGKRKRSDTDPVE
jgi:hypothetical protein